MSEVLVMSEVQYRDRTLSLQMDYFIFNKKISYQWQLCKESL